MSHSSSTIFSRILGQIGNYLIPDHVKRIMFIVTLYHYMTGDLENENLDDLDELSKAMRLAKTSSSALILPGMFTGQLWTKSIVDRLLRVRPDTTERRLFTLIPCWLHYGRGNDIAKDIVDLRNYVEQGKAS